jgi:hypothetical protein
MWNHECVMHTVIQAVIQALALGLIAPSVAHAGDAWINTPALPGRTLTWQDDSGRTVVGKPGANLQLWRWPDGTLHTSKPGTWLTLPRPDEATTSYIPNGKYQSFQNQNGSITLFAPSP